MKTSVVMRFFEDQERRRAELEPSYRARAPIPACAKALNKTKGGVRLWGELVPPLSAMMLADLYPELRDSATRHVDPWEYVAAGWGRQKSAKQ